MATLARWCGVHVGAQSLVVEGIQPEPCRRRPTAAVPHGAHVVEVNNRDPHNAPTADLEGVRKLIGEHCLAGAVDAVDAHPDAVVCGRFRHHLGHRSQQTGAPEQGLIAPG
jgi:hypothetical protein